MSLFSFIKIFPKHEIINSINKIILTIIRLPDGNFKIGMNSIQRENKELKIN